MDMTPLRTFVLFSVVVPIAAWFGWLVGATGDGMGQPTGPTPPSCVRALDIASEGFDNNADAMDAARRAVLAASAGDKRAVREATADLDDANGRLEQLAPKAGEANRACRRGE